MQRQDPADRDRKRAVSTPINSLPIESRYPSEATSALL
jgi:hypothetical protein